MNTKNKDYFLQSSVIAENKYFKSLKDLEKHYKDNMRRILRKYAEKRIVDNPICRAYHGLDSIDLDRYTYHEDIGPLYAGLAKEIEDDVKSTRVNIYCAKSKEFIDSTAYRRLKNKLKELDVPQIMKERKKETKEQAIERLEKYARKNGLTFCIRYGIIDTVWIETKDGEGRSQGEKISYYDDGVLRFKHAVVDGLKHGMCRNYHANGTLASEVFYQNNEKCCEYLSKYNNGKTDEKSYWLNGKRHGKCIQYHKDGTLKMECEHVHGKLIGEEIWHFKNNKLN